MVVLISFVASRLTEQAHTHALFILLLQVNMMNIMGIISKVMLIDIVEINFFQKVIFIYILLKFSTLIFLQILFVVSCFTEEDSTHKIIIFRMDLYMLDNEDIFATMGGISIGEILFLGKSSYFFHFHPLKTHMSIKVEKCRSVSFRWQ